MYTIKPVCEHQAPEHREPVTGKKWKWFYNCWLHTKSHTTTLLLLLCVYIMIEEQLRDLESSLACRVCLHSLLRDCVGEDMQSTDALQRQERSCTRAIHTRMHAHKQVHNYVCSESLWNYYIWQVQIMPFSIVMIIYVVRPSVALASLHTLRPAYGRPQRAQCFNL